MQARQRLMPPRQETLHSGRPLPEKSGSATGRRAIIRPAVAAGGDDPPSKNVPSATGDEPQPGDFGATIVIIGGRLLNRGLLRAGRFRKRIGARARTPR